MKSLLAILLLTGCATTLPNGCLVDAVSHRQAIEAKTKLQGATSFNEVLFVTGGAYGDGEKTLGHCYNVFLWKPGSNTLYAFDRRGSQRVRAFISDPDGIARALRPAGTHGEILQ